MNENFIKNTEIKSTLGEALFPKVRRKVLTLFLLNDNKKYYFREAVRLLNESNGAMQRELKSLTLAGILKTEKIGMQRFYQANQDCPIYKDLKSIVEKTFGIVDLLKNVLYEYKNSISSAFIYGSIAEGTDSSQSDIDLMVIGSIPYKKLISIIKPVEKNMMRPLNPSLYELKEFKSKINNKNNFLNNIKSSKKLFIIGSEDDFRELV